MEWGAEAGRDCSGWQTVAIRVEDGSEVVHLSFGERSVEPEMQERTTEGRDPLAEGISATLESIRRQTEEGSGKVIQVDTEGDQCLSNLAELYFQGVDVFGNVVLDAEVVFEVDVLFFVDFVGRTTRDSRGQSSSVFAAKDCPVSSRKKRLYRVLKSWRSCRSFLLMRWP